MQVWSFSSKVIASLLFILSVSPARAIVRLELRPATQSIAAGQQVAVGIYAVADPAEPVGIVQIVLSWNASFLTLTGKDDTGAASWGTSPPPGFPVGGLNTDFGDGDAFFTAQATASPCSPVTASPAGLLLTTLLFDVGASPGTSTVDIVAMLSTFETRVWNNPVAFCSGVVVPSSIGQSASVTVVACADVGECDDTNACTNDACSAGVCQHLNNFDDTQFCCNPTNGGLLSLFDGNDCTGTNPPSPGTPGQCDPSDGQVTHDPLPSGTMCGDQTNTTCTNPDTCDGLGNCEPNHAGNGNFCELDGDSCTRDRCSGGDCAFVQNEDEGTFCDDGQDNCTPGQDICQIGVCTGTADPCIGQPGDFCLETEEIGPPCFNGDIDCAAFPGMTCDNDPIDPRCKRPFTCGFCRPGFSDCPDDGDCFAPTCAAPGVCIDFLQNDRCQDGLFCNGNEVCLAVGSPPIAGTCAPDATPPCVGLECREETCCDGPTCSVELCECVECLIDSDCDDNAPCNGLEFCDLATFTCIPGVPVDCSFLDEQCMEGVCNPLDGFCLSQPANIGSGCNDGQSCTSVDICTAEGLCEGTTDESPDGTVDLQWDPINFNQGELDQNVGEIVRFDFWAAANDVQSCNISGTPCPNGASDCSMLCAIDGVTPCTNTNDCFAVGGGSCNISQTCVPPEHTVFVIQAVINFDPTVLQLIGNSDPCDAVPADCTECTDDTNCAAGVSCFCPGGPPCGVSRCAIDGVTTCTIDDDCIAAGGGLCSPTAVGVCQTGKYDWGASGFPSGGSGNDPNGLNLSFTDGEALYLAIARSGVIQPEPEAPVLGAEPLWVTTLEFFAIDGAAPTAVTFNMCVPGGGEFPTRTRVIGDDNKFIRGNLGQVSIRIRECTTVAECDDLIACTADSCDADGQCVHTPDDQSCTDTDFCNGVDFCDPQTGCVSPGDPCTGQGLFCKQPPGVCVECLQSSHCDDTLVCTDDTCSNDVCVHQDTCADDNTFCNGIEFCNASINGCDSTGDPCPGFCTEVNQCPGCDTPLVEAVGSRFIAITPQPEVNPAATAFLVTSPDWPCLSKFVGTFRKCGGTEEICKTDADCNSCTLLNSACLSDTDCKTCQGTTNNCQTSAECSGAPCESIQVCQFSGLSCQQASFFEEIDIDQDGIADGIVATLVDDPADRALMTAEEWGTTTYPRCSQSQEPCVTDGDCDVGQCAVSGRSCSMIADNCSGLCAIAQTECSINAECLLPGDTCSQSQTCVPFETCQAGKIYVMSPDILPSDVDLTDGTFFPTTYTVVADCGALSDPANVVMRLWADADDNGTINIGDAQLTIIGFQGSFLPAIPSRTMVAFDIQGSICTPNQEVNINDVLLVILAFKGDKFNPDVLNSSVDCGTPCP